MSYSNPLLLRSKEKKLPFSAVISLCLARWLLQYRRWGGGEAGSSSSDREAAEILLLPGWNQFKLPSSHLTSIDRALHSISHSHVDQIEASLSQWPVVRYFQSQSKFFWKLACGTLSIGASWMSDDRSVQLFQVKLYCLKFINSNVFHRFESLPGTLIRKN